MNSNKAEQVLSSTLVGDICKDVPFEVSATKIYLDDIAKEMPEFFSDKAAMISLICNISPSEDLMINMAYGLAYGIPASSDAHDAVNVFYDHYCRFIDRIVLEYADKNVKNDKDILRNVLELYCDRRKYIYPYYKDVYELPGLCYAVPHELLMDEEIFSKVLYIADPGEVYNELLTDEEKLDKGIVCRLLKELKYSDFSYFKEGFCNLCDNVSRDILMDKEVCELFFRSGIPSLIYEEILTEKERLDDDIIFDLLKAYEKVSFPDYKHDYMKLKELWAEAIIDDFRYNEYAGRVLELIEPGADEDFCWIVENFLGQIGSDSCEVIDNDMQDFLRMLSKKDLNNRAKWEQHKMDAVMKILDGEGIPELYWAMTSLSTSESPYLDSARLALEPYMYQFKLFDKVAAGDFSYFAGVDNDSNESEPFMNFPTGVVDDVPFE